MGTYSHATVKTLPVVHVIRDEEEGAGRGALKIV